MRLRDQLIKHIWGDKGTYISLPDNKGLCNCTLIARPEDIWEGNVCPDPSFTLIIHFRFVNV